MNKVHAVFPFLLLGGCLATGVDLTKVDIDAHLDTTPDQRVAVEVEDRRPYVMSGQQEPNIVAIWPGRYPLYLYTASGKPLANDLSDVVTRSLANQGLSVIDVSEIGMQDILLRFTLREWKVEVLGDYDAKRYLYDVDLTVLDGTGKVISQRNVADICAYDMERYFELINAGIDPLLRNSANVFRALLDVDSTQTICVDPLMTPVPESRIVELPPSGKARIVFFRPPDSYSALKIQSIPILDIGPEKQNLVGFLSVGRQVSYLSEPGEKLFMTVDDDVDVMRAYLDAGKTYYVKLKSHVGWGKHFSLQPIRQSRIHSEGIKGNIRTITIVENTEASYRWLTINQDRVSEKKSDALKTWSRMSAEEKSKHTLLARDGE